MQTHVYKEIAREDTAVGQKLPHKGKNREECQDWWSGFWRAYTLDMIMTLHERDEWEDDDDLDEEIVERLNEEG